MTFHGMGIPGRRKVAPTAGLRRRLILVSALLLGVSAAPIQGSAHTPSWEGLIASWRTHMGNTEGYYERPDWLLFHLGGCQDRTEPLMNDVYLNVTDYKGHRMTVKPTTANPNRAENTWLSVYTYPSPCMADLVGGGRGVVCQTVRLKAGDGAVKECSFTITADVRWVGITAVASLEIAYDPLHEIGWKATISHL